MGVHCKCQKYCAHIPPSFFLKLLNSFLDIFNGKAISARRWLRHGDGEDYGTAKLTFFVYR